MPRADDAMLGAVGIQSITDEDRAQVEVVLAAAQAWKDGDLTLLEAQKIGGTRYRGRLVPGRTRAIAMRITPNTDPRKADLRELVDQLILLKGNLITEFGVFSKPLLLQSDRMVGSLFPVDPVRRKPVDTEFTQAYDDN